MHSRAKRDNINSCALFDPVNMFDISCCADASVITIQTITKKKQEKKKVNSIFSIYKGEEAGLSSVVAN